MRPKALPAPLKFVNLLHGDLWARHFAAQHLTATRLCADHPQQALLFEQAAGELARPDDAGRSPQAGMRALRDLLLLGGPSFGLLPSLSAATAQPLPDLPSLQTRRAR